LSDSALRLVATDLGAIRGERTIFTGLALTAAAGELVAVTGPNGAGKTTLLRILAGLARPSTGTIRLEPGDAAPAGADVHYLGHSDGLKPALSLYENVDFWRRLGGPATASTDEALDLWGLLPVADIPVVHLSAGQKRRAALARLNAGRRPIWLLDEPTASLDADAHVTLGRMIALHLSTGGLVVAATHADLPVAPDRTVELERGG
jgi:heme exporter protein A